MLFIHLSDIHFKAKDIKRGDDPNAGLRDNLIQDVKYMRERLDRPASGILISGDIAFAGAAAEYDFALEWLETKLCPASGCSLDDVFVIPGNHDVDRKKASAMMHRDARAKLREYPAAEVNDVLREYLSDGDSAQLLFSPIDSYNRFAARFFCAVGAYDTERPDSRPYATRNCALNDGSTLRLWGFNSVLVSDASDDKDRMLVDPMGAQIQREDGVVHLVMCHHPYSWLRNGADFQSRIEEVAHVHLFGHEHTRRVEEGKYFTTIRAGAVQPERDGPAWKPGYNWIELEIDKSGADNALKVSIWVRQQEGEQFIAVPDRQRNDPWIERHSLEKWPDFVQEAGEAMSDPAGPPEGLKKSPDSESEGPAPSAAVDVRSIAIKMFRLNEHQQRQIIVDLKLDSEGDQDLKDYEFALAAIRRASERGALEELHSRIISALGGSN